MRVKDWRYFINRELSTGYREYGLANCLWQFENPKELSMKGLVENIEYSSKTGWEYTE